MKKGGGRGGREGEKESREGGRKAGIEEERRGEEGRKGRRKREGWMGGGREYKVCSLLFGTQTAEGAQTKGIFLSLLCMLRS